MHISSYSLPPRATHFSDCAALVCRACPPPWPRCAASGLLKTRNQLCVDKLARRRERGAENPVRGLMDAERDPSEGSKQHLDNLRRKDSLRRAETAEISVR